MFFYNLDFLSPPITLYYKSRYKHSSVPSGIITILSYSVILACIIYYTINFIDKVNPSIYFFNRYVEDVGIYPLNESSLFHYINLISTSRERNIDFDLNSIRIYGIQRTIETYLNNYEYFSNNHWEYGLCNYDEDITNKKFYNLIDKKTFSKSVCIKRYYNSKNKTYFNKGESGFVLPTLNHGVSHPNRTFYGIIIDACQNNSIKNNCNSIEEINSFFSKHALSLNFIDYYADVLNYNEPFIPYINSITDGLINSSTLSINNLNFNPSLIRTYYGFFAYHLMEEKSYSFVQNEKNTLNRQGKQIIASFYFWMQNHMIYNDRYYKRIQDLLSNIGGIGSLILLIGFIINSFINPYIILLDTQNLIFNIGDINFIKSKEIKKPMTFIKVKDNEKETFLQNININSSNTIRNSKCPRFKNDESENKKLELGNYNINKNRNKKKFKKKNSFMNSFNSKILIKHRKPIKRMSKTDFISDKKLKEFDLEKVFFEIKDKNNQTMKKPIKKQNFSWCNYILYVIFFKRKNPKIKFYENFRAQILSEESLMQNNLDIYKLLNHCNIKSISLFRLIKYQQ